MNKIYKKHVFVCENQRNSSSEKSCGKVGVPLRIHLKREIDKKKLNKKIRINKSGCLGKCNQGPCFVIYPEGKWHFNVELEEYEKIINQLISE